MEERSDWKWKTGDLKTISESFYETCARFPDSTAQIFNPDQYSCGTKGKLTWSELLGIVESYACGLMSLGVNHQDRIGIISQSSPFWTQADMAICCSGCVSVAIFPNLSDIETEYLLNDSQCRFLFAGNEKILEMLLPMLNRVRSLEKIIIMDPFYVSTDVRIISIASLKRDGDKWKNENYSDYTERRMGISLKDWYTIIYTSGTTGEGKGVILTHFNGAARMAGVDEFFKRYGMNISEKDTTLCFLPLAHIFDRGSCQLTAIMNGSAIAYSGKAGNLIEDLQMYNPSWFNSVPALYEKIYLMITHSFSEKPLKKFLFDTAMGIAYRALEYRKDSSGSYNMHPDFDLRKKLPLVLRIKFIFADKFLSKIRSIFGKNFRYSFTASASLSPGIIKFYYAAGLAVVEGYGLTESFNACILNPITGCKPGYLGINANGGMSRVAEDGELEISDAGVFSEYLNKPGETEDAFTSDGWFKTGDLVLKDSSGYYKIYDRKKNIICTTSGKNISPAKLEKLFAGSNFIEQIFFAGEDKKFITALIVPAFDNFIDLFEREGVKYNRESIIRDNSSGLSVTVGAGEDFVQIPRLNELIYDEVQKANTNLENFEQIKQYTIVSEKFTEQNGMLTPSQKTKKRVILEKFSSEIEKMYL